MNSMRWVSFPVIAFMILALLQLTSAQTMAPASAPSSNDGTAIDQGIAYALLLVALAITYFAH